MLGRQTLAALPLLTLADPPDLVGSSGGLFRLLLLQ